MLTEHGRLKSYCYRFKIIEDPTSTSGGGCQTAETVQGEKAAKGYCNKSQGQWLLGGMASQKNVIN